MSLRPLALFLLLLFPAVGTLRDSFEGHAGRQGGLFILLPRLVAI